MPQHIAKADLYAMLARFDAGDPFLPVPLLIQYIERLESTFRPIVDALAAVAPDYARAPAEAPLLPGIALTCGQLAWARYLLTDPADTQT